MDRTAVAGVLGVASAVWALAVPLIAASRSASYSQVSQYISELGAQGAECGAVVSAAGFAPTGALALAFLVAAAPLLPHTRAARAGIFALGAVGAAYGITAVFPCDPGCPSAGSLSQSIHSAAGLLEYAGALAGFALLAPLARTPGWRALGRASALAAALVALGFAGMLAPSFAPQRGLAQRVAEAGIFGWFAAAGWLLVRRARPPASGGRPG